MSSDIYRDVQGLQINPFRHVAKTFRVDFTFLHTEHCRSCGRYMEKDHSIKSTTVKGATISHAGGGGKIP